MPFIQHFIIIHSIYKNTIPFTPIEGLSEAVKLAAQNNIKSEIIGQWLYCFTNPLIGEQLQSIGFWYSYKHKAFIYSGGEKQGIANYETLNEIRARLGSRKI